MFGNIARFRPLFTLVSILFLYEQFGHKSLFNGYKEKHSLCYSYQINCDFILNSSNKIFG